MPGPFDDLIPAKPQAQQQPNAQVLYKGAPSQRAQIDTRNAALEAQRKQQQIDDAEFERRRKERQDQATGGVDASVDQGKAAAFALRAREANAAYEGAGLDPDTMLGSYGNQAFPRITANFSSDKRNAVRGNEREFIAGVLRYDSGAAIPDTEYESAYQIYFPSSNAGPEEIASKRAARARAIEGLLVGAGPAATKLPQSGQTATLAAPDATSTTIPVPPEMQSEIGAYVAQNKGRLDPQDFASAFNFIAQKYGYEGRIDPNSPQTLAEIEALNRGATYGGLTPLTRDLSANEQGLNAFAQSNIGAGLIGVGQAVTGNFLDELAGGNATEGVRQIEENSPIASGVGQVAGGLLLPIGKAASTGKLAAVGAGYGAVSGAGNADGDLGDRAQGALLGAGIGAAGGYFGSKLLAKLGGPKPPSNPGGGGGQSMAASIDAGIIDQTIGGARGGMAAVIENTLANAPGSSGRIRAAQQTAIDQATTAADDVAAKFGQGGSFESRGEALQRGAKNWISRFEEVSSKAYDSIPISRDAPATLSATQATLADLTGKFASNPKLAAALQNSRLSQYMDALGETGAPLSWNDLKAFRSRIGEEIGQFSFGDGLAKSELRSLYAALSDDMKATAASFGPQALAKFNRANDLYRQGQERIDSALVSILGKNGDNAPEAAGALIEKISKSNKSTSDIKKLAAIRSSMPKDEWSEVSSSMIRLLGQPLNSDGRTFSPKTFIDSYNDMAPAAKNIIFGQGDELRGALDDFAGVMNSMKALQGEGNPSGTAKGLNILLGLSNLTSLGTQAVAANVLSRVWTNPRFAKWATGYSKMLKGAAAANGAPNNAKQMELLGKVAAAEPAIAADIAGLQQALSQAFASTPARLAADPQEDGGK